MDGQNDLKEIRENEVEALKAIYMEDFHDCTTPSPWHLDPIPSFTIDIRSSSAPAQELQSSKNTSGNGTNAATASTWVAIRLKVDMTTTYPRSLPLLSLELPQNLHPKQVDSLKSIMNSTAKSLVGQEMIFEIASVLQDQLNEYERMGIEAPSLEEARLSRIKEAEELERQRSDAVKKRELEESLEQERALEKMVQDELSRRQKDSSPRPSANKPLQSKDELDEPLIDPSIDSSVLFDRVIVYRRTDGKVVRFQQVVGKIPTTTNFFGESFIVRPLLRDSITGEERIQEFGDGLHFLLTEITLDEPFWNSSKGRSLVHDLESELDSLHGLHHDYVIPLYASKIVRKKSGGWMVYLLTQYSSIGTVGDLLDAVDTVNLKVARSWSIQLLEALEYVHKNGIVHRRLTTDNVMLFRYKELGETVAKLGNVGFGQRLIDMNSLHPFRANAKANPTELSWPPPELIQATESTQTATRKTDIWEFGVLFVKMIAGKSIPNEFVSPKNFIAASGLPDALVEFLSLIFKESPKKRPSAFDLLPSQFLRTDTTAMKSLVTGSVPYPRKLADPVKTLSSSLSASSISNSLVSGDRPSVSRYANDFEEGVVLGRGAYGEVVKARNKVDGRYYAIKKIRATESKLTHILQEAWLLSRLNHQYVVRYFTAWLEESSDSGDIVEDDTEEDSDMINPQNTKSLSLLLNSDFVSNSRTGGGSSYPDIQFGSDSDGESCDSDNESVKSANSATSSTSAVTPGSGRKLQFQIRQRQQIRSTLFIQMEYCEKHTLTDLIRDGLYSQPDNYWRLFEQILQALSHIHGEGIIHRDLKPMNIFIDQGQNVKIGDFGLAKSTVQSRITPINASETATPKQVEDDLTTDVGTTFYVAPEVLKNKESHGSYDEKVDMYSLGIIFFEMCFPLRTYMERATILKNIRLEGIDFPADFTAKKYASEREIIVSLLDHVPKNRPSATKLLHSGLIPMPHRDDALKDALRSLKDVNSPWLYQVCQALFSRPLSGAQQVLYDRTISKGGGIVSSKGGREIDSQEGLIRMSIENSIWRVFLKHGAVENWERSRLFPRSALYDSSNIVELMDPSGNILQLPIDLTLPFARRLAETAPNFEKSFTFGTVFRRNNTAGNETHPISSQEVDFDIVTSQDVTDLAYSEAEVLKVLDEILESLECFKNVTVSFYLNHSNLLDSVLSYCSVPVPQRSLGLKLLGPSGLAPAGQNIKRERLNKFKLSSTALDDLEMFGFKEKIEGIESRLTAMMGATNVNGLRDTLGHLQTVVSYLRKLGVTRKIFIVPLSNYDEVFYQGGVMFQAVIEDKSQHGVIAAGGRYDKLISRFRHASLDRGMIPVCAAGFNMNLEPLTELMMKYSDALGKKAAKLKSRNSSIQSSGASASDQLALVVRPRCDVLVSSFTTSNIKGVCIDILRDLWQSDIRADLVTDCTSSQALTIRAEKDRANWVVVAKQTSAYNTSGNFKPLRVKNVSQKIDTDLGYDELITHLRDEISERNRVLYGTSVVSSGVSYSHNNSAGSTHLGSANSTFEGNATSTLSSTTDDVASSPSVSSKVTILSETGKLKGGKKNKWQYEEDSKAGLQNYLQSLANCPIYCLDVKDDTLDAILATSPDQPDEWRRKVVSTSLSQKGYLHSVQSSLAKEMARNTERVVLYSTKTGKIGIHNLE